MNILSKFLKHSNPTFSVNKSFFLVFVGVLNLVPSRAAFLVSAKTNRAAPFTTVVTSAIRRVNGDNSGGLPNDEEDNRNNNNKNNKKSDNSDRERTTPRTGWNHNLPPRSSDFWKPSDGTKKSTFSSSSSSSSSSSQSTRLRTGWLHNTKPVSQQQQEEEKEFQQMDDNEEKLELKTSKSQPMSSSASSWSPLPTPLARERRARDIRRQERGHGVLHPPTFCPCGPVRLAVTEHVMMVPLVRPTPPKEENKEQPPHPQPPQRIQVYFTVVEKVTDESRPWLEALSDASLSPTERASRYVRGAQLSHADDLLLYLQGGPGFGAPNPLTSLGFASPSSSWAAQALLSSTIPVNKLVLMDQRGTGRSTPVTKQYLEMIFPDLFLLDHLNDTYHDNSTMSSNTTTEDWQSYETTHPAETQKVRAAVTRVTDFLSHFRADNIVRDAEDIRDALLWQPEDTDADDNVTPLSIAKPWGCVLGQSFGGFCVMSYLSLVDNPPRVNLFTGGIAPMLTPIEQVYASLWERVRERNLRYYEMYPGDIGTVKLIVRTLLHQPPRLHSGGRLTARRFLQLGLSLGSSPSTFASLHSLIHSAFLSPDTTQFSRAFLKNIETQQSFDDHPIYFWLHESIYADGTFNGATNWAAHSVYSQMVQSSSDFDYQVTCSDDDDRPVLFFGEMVFPWMAEDYAELRGVGLSNVAHALAAKTDWPRLFDANKMRAALDQKCSAAAVVYFEDLYVDFDASMKVTKRGGPLEKCKVYVTNEFQHSGLRDDGANLFAKLYGMATGTIRTPS